MIPNANVPLFENVTDAQLNGIAARSKEDPSYRRPLTNRRPIRAPVNPKSLGNPTVG
jgi:hypothetical protein